MKSRARTLMWWPNIDKEIEQKVKSCVPCQVSRSAPPSAPLQPWSWPDKPWSRLHLDYADPLENKMFLIVIDAYSKWLDVFPVSSATSEVIMVKLRILFATHGIPTFVVTDNASIFVSAEMKKFWQNNSIHHITSTPYHPATNGIAERAVQTFKAAFKHMDSGSIQTRISWFLFNYSITPQDTTGISPAELLMKHKLHSRLDQLIPDISTQVAKTQEKQKSYHDSKASDRQFTLDDRVMVRKYSQGDPWVQARVIEQSGPVSYKVSVDSTNQMWRRHQDDIRQFSPEMVTDNFEIMPNNSDSVATHKDDSPQLSPVPFTDPGEPSSELVTGWPRRNIKPRE